MSKRAKKPNTTRTPRSINISALERGVAVLRCFQSVPAGLTHGEISRLTGIPKPTVTRLVTTLISVGFLRQTLGADKYALSAGVLWMARAFLSSLDIRAIARPHMVDLAERTGMSVYIGLRDGLDMVLIETCRSQRTMLFSRLDVGSRVPMLTSGLGRAYISALDLPERAKLIEQLRAASGSDWSRLATRLERAMQDAGDRGYCLSIGALHPEIMSIAVALRTGDGEPIGLACAGPAFSFEEKTLRKVVAPLLRETARTIAREIGGSVQEVAALARSAARGNDAAQPVTSARRTRSELRLDRR